MEILELTVQVNHHELILFSKVIWILDTIRQNVICAIKLGAKIFFYNYVLHPSKLSKTIQELAFDFLNRKFHLI